MNATGDSIWTLGEKFIEAGASQDKIIQATHKVQTFALSKGLGGQAGRDVITALEKAIKSKDKYDLAAAMGLLYGAHLGNVPQNLISFSEDTSNIVKQYISEL